LSIFFKEINIASSLQACASAITIAIKRRFTFHPRNRCASPRVYTRQIAI